MLYNEEDEAGSKDKDCSYALAPLSDDENDSQAEGSRQVIQVAPAAVGPPSPAML